MKRSFFSIVITFLTCFFILVNSVHAVSSHHPVKKTVSKKVHKPVSKKKSNVHAVHDRQKHKKRHSKKRIAHKKRTMVPAYSSNFKTPAYLNEQDQLLTSSLLPSVDLVYKTMDSLNYSYYKLGGSRFNLDEGVFIVDCSSYVDRVLLETFPYAYRHFTNSMQTDRPTTEHYYEFFKQIERQEQQDPYWGVVDAVHDLKAGDILVFRYKNSRGRAAGGHVMVVMETPKKSTDGYLVKVADAAASGHSHDTRSKGISGIGIGIMQLKAHPKTGKPLAFAWKVGAWWKRNVDIIIGRPMLKEGEKRAA